MVAGYKTGSESQGLAGAVAPRPDPGLTSTQPSPLRCSGQVGKDADMSYPQGGKGYNIPLAKQRVPLAATPLAFSSGNHKLPHREQDWSHENFPSHQMPRKRGKIQSKAQALPEGLAVGRVTGRFK